MPSNEEKLAEAKQQNKDVQNWLKLEEGNSDSHSDARVKMQQLAKTKKEEKSKCEDILNHQKKEIQQLKIKIINDKNECNSVT